MNRRTRSLHRTRAGVRALRFGHHRPPASASSFVKPLMRYVTFIVLVVCVMPVGCDPIAHERVTLQLPSASEAEAAKSAVELIGEVMATNGFRSVSTSVHSNRTIVAGFAGTGRLGCFVYHRSDQIQIVMNEMGKFKSRPEAIKARDDLKRRLSERFGKDKVSE